jgi:hypothetical protein
VIRNKNVSGINKQAEIADNDIVLMASCLGPTQLEVRPLYRSVFRQGSAMKRGAYRTFCVVKKNIMQKYYHHHSWHRDPIWIFADN